MEQAIDLAGNKGTVMMFGLTKSDAQISVKPFQLFQKELTLKASYINPCIQQRALELIDSGRLDVQSMVCKTIHRDHGFLSNKTAKFRINFFTAIKIIFHSKLINFI